VRRQLVRNAQTEHNNAANQQLKTASYAVVPITGMIMPGATKCASNSNQVVMMQQYNHFYTTPNMHSHFKHSLCKFSFSC